VLDLVSTTQSLALKDDGDDDVYIKVEVAGMEESWLSTSPIDFDLSSREGGVPGDEMGMGGKPSFSLFSH
jgi:hypothetical protein